MIEEMYNAMARITELKNRFGLNKAERLVRPQGELNATFGEMTDKAIRLNHLLRLLRDLCARGF